MIDRCPVCEYSLEGLPEEHTCPECGFAYEKRWSVVRAANFVRSAAMISYGIVLANIGILIWKGNYVWPFIFIVLAIAGMLLHMPKMSRFVLICPCHVRLFNRGTEIDRVELRDVRRAEWSWIDGCIYISDSHGRRRLEMSSRFLQSHAATRRVVAAINDQANILTREAMRRD
jgi:hypothetical protein